MKNALIIILTAAGPALSVNLSTGLYGGISLPTGDMAQETGSDLGKSTAILAVANIYLKNNLGIGLNLGYNSNYRPRTKNYSWAEYTWIAPVTAGLDYRLYRNKIGINVNAGGGYYILGTKLVGTIDAGVLNSGFPNRAYPAYFTIKAPGLYVGADINFIVNRLAFGFMPKYNYVFNRGEHDGEVRRMSGGQEITGVVSFNKPWNDAYTDLLIGVTYFGF